MRQLAQARESARARQSARARKPARLRASFIVSRRVAEELAEGRSGWASMANPSEWTALRHRKVPPVGLAPEAALKGTAWGRGDPGEGERAGRGRWGGDTG